jgi:hypothetical protein
VVATGLIASDTDTSDAFGRAVFIDGDTVVVGSFLEAQAARLSSLLRFLGRGFA